MIHSQLLLDRGIGIPTPDRYQLGKTMDRVQAFLSQSHLGEIISMEGKESICVGQLAVGMDWLNRLTRIVYSKLEINIKIHNLSPNRDRSLTIMGQVTVMTLVKGKLNHRSLITPEDPFSSTISTITQSQDHVQSHLKRSTRDLVTIHRVWIIITTFQASVNRHLILTPQARCRTRIITHPPQSLLTIHKSNMVIRSYRVFIIYSTITSKSIPTIIHTRLHLLPFFQMQNNTLIQAMCVTTLSTQ
jgi:hypothetical protein